MEMSIADEKGTGKHPHKDSKEPWPHHEGSSQSEREDSGETRSATGRHQEESSSRQQPRESGSSEHRKESSSREQRKESGGGEHRKEAASGEQESRDLKEREYRDKEGNIHHHTHTSQKMKDKDKERKAERDPEMHQTNVWSGVSLQEKSSR